jgi:hypothetical protein
MDALETELRQPYIERPEEIEEGKGQTCWLDQNRSCEPDCTAFNIFTDTPQGPERCVLVVYTANSAVQSQQLVQITKKAARILKIKAEDDQRASLAAAPIPDPFGGTR